MKPGIPELLQQLADLLEQHGEEPWATGLRRLLSEYNVDPNVAKADIRRLYGGMGSFNDVILQDSNGPLRSENDELDRLRSELYSACRA
jgi:hypothetical protein